MIPLRVYIKNYLCHAEQEFRFEEHPVWLLHGPNGVGKSAVFDAMVYALYCKSRRSDDRKNAVGDVIRHGESSMRVRSSTLARRTASRYRAPGHAAASQLRVFTGGLEDVGPPSRISTAVMSSTIG